MLTMFHSWFLRAVEASVSKTALDEIERMTKLADGWDWGFNDGIFETVVETIA